MVGVPKWSIFKALLHLSGAKIAQNGLKMGSFHFVGHPECRVIIFRMHFWAISNTILVPKKPKSAKIAYNRLDMGSFNLFVHPKRCSITFGKTCF